ncbi:MAG TPA: OmpA family protein [Saprospiraceae bacterium]|nr:OmpA family protein [Saprospiraceae bacterium]
MIKMIFEEHCYADPDLSSKTRLEGCTSYLQSKLTAPLEVGAVYELSFWVYFPADTIVESSIRYNIGILPSLHALDMSANNMLHVKKFFHDTIPNDQWFQVKKYIRALCPLEYIVIGAFRSNTFPTLNRLDDDPITYDHYPFYFIDDVKVEKVNEDTLPSMIVPTPYCKFYEDEDKRLEVALNKNMTVHFDSDAYSFSLDDQNRLDSFITAIEERWKPVYSIVGHTDDTGHENETLSKKRADTLATYLQLQHGIPDFRTITFGVGSELPTQDNSFSTGRAQNRRATITVTSLSKPMGLYRHCLTLIEKGKHNEAIKELNKWISIADYYLIIYALFDYRLQPLKNHPGWKSEIYGAIKNRYRNHYPSMDAFYLDSLRCEDQRYRTLEGSILNLSGYFKDFEDFEFDQYNIDVNKLIETDSQHINALTSYLKSHDFPKISQIGRRNVEGLIFMLIHAGDTNQLKIYLPLIEKRCLEGEAEWLPWAMMHDKLKQLQNRPQEYGMQFIFINPEKTELQLYRIDDLEAVNKRRRSIGVGPIRDAEEVIYLRRE